MVRLGVFFEKQLIIVPALLYCYASPIMRTTTQHFALSEKNTVVTMMILIQLYFVMTETKFLIFLYRKLNVWYCKTFMASWHVN